jgi:predicted nucleotidyltransferase
MDDAAIEHRLRAFLQTRAPEVVAAYLFGSVARGRSSAMSDVDVGVLLAKPPAVLADLPLDLEADLERFVGVPTQVVVLNSAPVPLKKSGLSVVCPRQPVIGGDVMQLLRVSAQPTTLVRGDSPRRLPAGRGPRRS